MALGSDQKRCFYLGCSSKSACLYPGKWSEISIDPRDRDGIKTLALLPKATLRCGKPGVSSWGLRNQSPHSPSFCFVSIKLTKWPGSFSWLLKGIRKCKWGDISQISAQSRHPSPQTHTDLDKQSWWSPSPTHTYILSCIHRSWSFSMVSKNETGRRAFSPLPTWGLLAIPKYVVGDDYQGYYSLVKNLELGNQLGRQDRWTLPEFIIWVEETG